MKINKQSWQRWWLKIKPYLLILTAAVVIISPQLIAHSTILGSDSIFHFNRFYETAKQIANHNFSFFQTNYGFQQSGRIINAIYGPVFAYVNGLLLGLVGTWYRYEVLTSLMIYWIAGVGIYQLALRIKFNKYLGILLAVIYMNIGWVPRWQTAQNMNAWGAALAPFLCICAVRMIQDHRTPVSSWQLMTMMVTIIQIHMLSSLFFVITLIPFFLYGLKTAVNRRAMWGATLKAVVGTIVLTANVWGALLAVQLTNEIAKPAPFKLTKSVLIPSFTHGTRDDILVGLLILCLAQIIYVMLHVTESPINVMVTSVGSFFLIMSSPLIPWRMIERMMPDLERLLQFPDRLTVVAYPLLLAGIALTIEQCGLSQRTRWQKFGVTALVCVAAWAQVANMSEIYEVSKSYHTDSVLVHQGGVAKHSPYDTMIRSAVHTLHPGQLLLLVEKRSPDYLPITKKNLGKSYVRSYVYEQQIIKHANEFKKTVLPRGRLQLSWHSNRNGQIRLPLITYQQSRLVLNGQIIHHYQRSTIGAPLVQQRRGENKVVLQFIQPGWLKLLIGLSLIGMTALLLFGIVQLVRSCLSEIKS
ncbi:cell division protein [uncultured Limosilactobacillus sp.]|uniref:cell division protein n=1 Tax=uncultured Limosilactobacillus sp. TaxID=2837629 RepID=UPI0025F017BF|nr:cell division protein [uncultured Limosilactobacillus sp.]